VFVSALPARPHRKFLQAAVIASLSTTRFHSPNSTYHFVRCYQNLAPETTKTPATKQPSSPAPPKGSDPENPTQAEQRKQDWKIIWKLMGNVWPKNDWSTRGRVLLGLGLLVGGKARGCLLVLCVPCLTYPYQLLNVQVPQLFKSVIDALNVDIAAGSTAWIVAGSIILGCRSHMLTSSLWSKPKCFSADGAARIGAGLSGELLNIVFANIGQRAIRKVSRNTFEHLLNLDLKFHLSRQTGGLVRAIDRGTK
jgi:ABC transporter ATM